MVPGVDRMVLATDSMAIADAVGPWGVEVVMTSDAHESGTDRVAEVSAKSEFAQYDVVVNLQGDEPFMPVDAVAGAIARVVAGDDIGTAASPLDPELRNDPARVKVVCGSDGRALYFSRAAIPHVRDTGDFTTTRWWQHLGVYAYRRDVLPRITALPLGILERSERLEQLRALAAGVTIGVAFLQEPAMPGIDTPSDLAAAELWWRELSRAAS
jgi:3-deoxy-manno-octulosonate cytidylyltransferase (CMP-KDO synthetase)